MASSSPPLQVSSSSCFVYWVFILFSSFNKLVIWVFILHYTHIVYTYIFSHEVQGNLARDNPKSDGGATATVINVSKDDYDNFPSFMKTLSSWGEINGKEVQIQLTGFMEKNTGKFMKELWCLLLSAQKNANGVPQQFFDAKEEEIKKKKVLNIMSSSANTYLYNPQFIPIENYATKTVLAAHHSQKLCSFMRRCKHYLLSGCSVLKTIYAAKEKHTYAMQLIKYLIATDSQWSYSSNGRDPRRFYELQYSGRLIMRKTKVIERPLILATKMGIIEMVKEIIKICSESLEFLQEDTGRNLLHLATEHRHEYILELLKLMKRDLANMVVGIDGN